MKQLKNGHFWGLSTIARTGDTSFTVEGNKARLTGENYRLAIIITILLPLQPTWELEEQVHTMMQRQSSWESP